MTTPLTTTTLDVSSTSRLLEEIYDSQRLPFKAGVLETMQGVTLATIANRLDILKGNPVSFFEYGGVLRMVRECESLAVHPIMGLYTVGIASLSYYEWKKLMR